MARVLVVYASRTKSTQEIAELVAEGIRFSGNEAVVVDVKEIKSEADFAGYDGYAFGSPTYHGEMLQSMKTMLFLAEKGKLKGLGAILLHDTAWVLPDTPLTREKLQWLTTEVREMKGGEATLWEAQEVFTGQDVNLAQQFIEQVNAIYRELLRNLEKPDADLATLAKRYQQAKLQDYFHSDLGEQVRQILVERRGAK